MVDLAGAAVVAIVTRAPSAGGKTRLFSALGRPVDRDLLRALLLDTVDATAAVSCSAASSASRSGRVERIIAVDPPDACEEVRDLVPGVAVVPQCGGTLGARMAAVMTTALDAGASAVAIIGSDLPDLRPHVIIAAFAALADDADALVLGPATDGGYYLIAARKIHPVFEGIEWGTNRVLAQTIAAADRLGIRVRFIETMRDVDSPADLAAVKAPHTRAWRDVNCRDVRF